MEEKLISAVANHPELYDASCYFYRDRNKKDLAWRHISEEIGQPEDICRRKWKSLRDTYNKEKRTEKEKRSGSAAGSGRRWKFFAVMGFLDPFLTPRETSESTDYAAEPSRCFSWLSSPWSLHSCCCTHRPTEDSSKAVEGRVPGRSIGSGAGHPGVPKEATPVSNRTFPRPCSCSGEHAASDTRIREISNV
ncbi:transcription factor Adf-1-like isoform X2 [Oreochromis niloticus]|uniref:transcription factor Adf-1-like isoform X2 n=1 Tax=Oreochromis niloticus TaxID=8128 RepID=UPI000674A902|nr:transcription factor Adf-1-like isoform X2 [Oreochromis niloticus]